MRQYILDTFIKFNVFKKAFSRQYKDKVNRFKVVIKFKIDQNGLLEKLTIIIYFWLQIIAIS
jgi:hypothetical protein